MKAKTGTKRTALLLLEVLLIIALCVGSAAQAVAMPQEIYLVITEDNLKKDIEPLTNWRYQQGYDVEITNLSEIPSANTNATSEDICDYIKTISPTYLLLVGNVPTDNFMISSGKIFATDFNYSRIDDDLYPDIFVGRLPADSITIVVNKILDYEKNPNMSSDWHNKVLLTKNFWMREVAEYNGDGIPWNRTVPKNFEVIRNGVGTGGGLEGLGYDCEVVYVINPWEKNETLSTPRPWYYTRSSGLEEREKMDPSIDVNGTTQDVMGSISEGAILVQYEGHGSVSGWCLFPPILNSDIAQMNNGDKLPLFVNICCWSGYFNYSYGDCFAEELIKEESGGAIGVIAACSTVGTPKEFYFEIYNSIWEQFEPDRPSSIEPIRGELGRILVSAKTRLLDINTLKEPVWGYNLIGDPALSLRTKVPQEIEVSTNFNSENGDIIIEITTPTTGEKINDALVCLTGGEALHISGRTENGSITFPAIFSSSEINVTVTGWNLLPYESAITTTLRGDVNQDGKVSMADAIMVLRMSTQGDYSTVADMDNNKEVNSLDALIIAQIAKTEGN